MYQRGSKCPCLRAPSITRLAVGSVANFAVALHAAYGAPHEVREVQLAPAQRCPALALPRRGLSFIRRFGWTFELNTSDLFVCLRPFRPTWTRDATTEAEGNGWEAAGPAAPHERLRSSRFRRLALDRGLGSADRGLAVADLDPVRHLDFGLLDVDFELTVFVARRDLILRHALRQPDYP